MFLTITRIDQGIDRSNRIKADMFNICGDVVSIKALDVYDGVVCIVSLGKPHQ